MIAMDINCVKHMLEIIEGKEIDSVVRDNVIDQLKQKIKNEDKRIRHAYNVSRYAKAEKVDFERNFQKEHILGNEL